MSEKQKLSKTQQSIARSLNGSFFGSFFFMLLMINLVVVVFVSYFALIDVEKQLDIYVKQLVVVDNRIISPITVNEISFTNQITLKPTYLFNQLAAPSTLENVTARKISFENFFSLSWFNQVDHVYYHVALNFQQQPITLTYDLSLGIRRFVSIYRWFFMFQVGAMIVLFVKQTKKTKAALHPLNQLSLTTKSIQQDLSALAVSSDSKQLKSISDAIEKIDLDRLNNKLQVTSSQGDLVVLTQAINDMLLRINQAVHLQTQFVSDASHELRTPISIIQGYVNLLDRWGKDDPSTMQESIDAIKNETENMKTLVEHLLFLARGDSDQLQLIFEPFDVVALLDEIIKESSLIDPLRTIEITADSALIITADRQLLKQALRILFDNAMKYSDQDTVIKCSCQQKEDGFEIAITDQGIGISHENIQRVFDRFYRDQQARLVVAKGSGLGLSIAKWIIEKHDGSIEIISRENIGTKVNLKLPNR